MIDADAGSLEGRPGGRRKQSRARGGLVRWLARWLVGGVLAFVVGSVVLVAVFRVVPVPVTITMLTDPNGFTKDWTSLSEINRNMVDAAIAGEDGKFCTHHGFDKDAIRQAWERNQEGGRIRGGSTISQQTAKNVFLWQGGGYFRKGLEAWFTVLIEHMWPKRRIIEVYLNVAETGIGTYGVEAGAQRYYHKSAANLSPVEAARIAAVFPLPKRRPVNGAEGFVRRHGNAIAAQIGNVRGGFDGCVYR